MNCQWGSWKTTPCSRSCGTGKRTKTRTKTVSEKFGGKCKGESSIEETCNTNSCPGNITWLICLPQSYLRMPLLLIKYG